MKNLLKSRNTGLIAVLIILLVIARFLTPGMFTATSLVSMLQNNTIYALLAIAEMMVILTGGIDISIASQLAFVGISCTTLACSHPGIPGIAASFTRTAADVKEIRDILEKNGGHDIKIIAKIENQQGVDNIDSIIEAADGIMIARGDMGVEIPLEDVPVIQKDIISQVYSAGKQVITATQMLDSMIKNPRPTRAETTDVANAIYQGTSAIMLSGETAAGKYPIEALKTMVKIARRTEADVEYNQQFSVRTKDDTTNVTTAISHATCMTAIDLNAKAIIAVTRSGNTARMVSKYRPGCQIIACTPDERTWRQLNMVWGVAPILTKEEYSMEILLLHATEAAEENGYVKKGDVVVLTVGVPLGRSGNTNLLKATVVGEY